MKMNSKRGSNPAAWPNLFCRARVWRRHFRNQLRTPVNGCCLRWRTCTILCALLINGIGSPAQAQFAQWVGNQSAGVQLGQTASFFDGNQWLNFAVPTEQDSVFFDSSYFSPPNVSSVIVFGDFTQDIQPPYTPQFIPGGSAEVDFLTVTRGTFTFDLDGRHLDILPDIPLSGLTVGTDAATASLTIRGGGRLFALSARVGDSATIEGIGSDGTIAATESGTSFEVEGYLQIGNGSTRGALDVSDGASVYVFAQQDGFGGELYIGGIHGHGRVELAGADTYGYVERISWLFENSLLEVRNGADFFSSNLYIENGAEVVIEGHDTIVTTSVTGISEGGTAIVRNDGLLDSFNITIRGDLTLESGGTLTSDHPINPVTIETSGSLRGSGSVISGGLRNLGTIVPGDSPGDMTFSGNFVNEGVIQIEIGGADPGQFDRLIVDGQVQLLAGSTIKVDFIDGYVPTASDVFPIFVSTEAVIDEGVLVELNGLGDLWKGDFANNELMFIMVPEPDVLGLACVAMGLFLIGRGRAIHRTGRRGLCFNPIAH